MNSDERPSSCSGLHARAPARAGAAPRGRPARRAAIISPKPDEEEAGRGRPEARRDPQRRQERRLVGRERDQQPADAKSQVHPAIRLDGPRRIEEHAEQRTRRHERHPRKEREIGQVRNRPEVALERIRQRRQRRRLRGSSASPRRSPQCATANAMTRARAVRNTPHSVAARTIDGPMMLRMSTFSIVHAGAWLRTKDWKRKTKASRKISRPRRWTARTAARVSPRAPRLRAGRHRDGDAGEKQEQRRAEPAEDQRLAEGARPPVRDARPAVDDVRLDHDEHGDAAQHVEIRPARRPGSPRLTRAMLADRA